MKISPEVSKIGSEIRSMKIRGAGRIARAAVRALTITAKKSKARSANELAQELRAAARYLSRTRPTAVSLPNGLRYVLKQVEDSLGAGGSLAEVRRATLQSAETFIQNSKMAVEQIGKIGSRRVVTGDVILTHCNSDAAISVITSAWQQGKRIEVFVTESRPSFQGHLTAKTLGRSGIPVTIIVDGAVRHFMNSIDKVIVGADAIAANGAVVNKIGTATIALAAKEARTPFLVAAETYKFSPDTITGELVRIEERSPTELVSTRLRRAMKNVRVANPVFDVTPPQYVDVIITERGVIPPQAAFSIIRDEFGWAYPREKPTSVVAVSGD